MNNRRSSLGVSILSNELKAALESRSYKKTHGTFAKYCKEVHGISRGLGYLYARGGRTGRRRSIGDSLRWKIWERDNFTCAYCGSRRFLSVDHVIPVSDGGGDNPENLQTLCGKCNRKKSNKITDREIIPWVLHYFDFKPLLKKQNEHDLKNAVA